MTQLNSWMLRQMEAVAGGGHGSDVGCDKRFRCLFVPVARFLAADGSSAVNSGSPGWTTAPRGKFHAPLELLRKTYAVNSIEAFAVQRQRVHLSRGSSEDSSQRPNKMNHSHAALHA